MSDHLPSTRPQEVIRALERAGWTVDRQRGKLAAIIKDGVQGLAIANGLSFTDPANYPVFIPVNWEAETTVRLRRTATGEAEIMEVNGIAPNPRALYSAGLPQGTRNEPTVEFGCSSSEAQATIDVMQFRSERPATAVPGTLAPTHMRIRDTDSSDRLRLRADFTLGGTSNGLNPASEPMQITLSTPLGGPSTARRSTASTWPDEPRAAAGR